MRMLAFGRPSFLQEVESWESGLVRGGSRSSADLRQAITRALYDYVLANATGPVEQAEIVVRAVDMLPPERPITPVRHR
jgi:hypothetical protein